MVERYDGRVIALVTPALLASVARGEVQHTLCLLPGIPGGSA